VAAAFKEAGILIHAYLMYGFPSETIQETIDSLERVRQLFAEDLMQSAFWHRFTTTAHSPIGLNPKSNGLRILGPKFEGFADNDLLHTDRIGETPDWLGEGLRRSMLNFLEGRGLKMDVQQWFDQQAPKPRVSSTWVRQLLKKRGVKDDPQIERRLVWLGDTPLLKRRGQRMHVTLPGQVQTPHILLSQEEADWLKTVIQQARLHKGRTNPYPLFREIQTSFPGEDKGFTSFLLTPAWIKVRNAGLLLL
jgi:hypothetical protein